MVIPGLKGSLQFPPSIYHGDEIEVDCNEAIWTTKKTLRVIKYLGFFNRRWLIFFLELKVDDPNVQSFAGVFIDEAEEPAIEKRVSSTDYELFVQAIYIGEWEIGTHLIEIKLKSEDTIHNRIFEIWVA